MKLHPSVERRRIFGHNKHPFFPRRRRIFPHLMLIKLERIHRKHLAAKGWKVRGGVQDGERMTKPAWYWYKTPLRSFRTLVLGRGPL